MLPKISNIFAAYLLLFLVQPFIIVHSRTIKSGEKYFKLQDLEGIVQKGQTVDGVREIKKYLKNYGYYPTNIVDLNDDYFDDTLKSAVQTYQKYYHLKVTGKIDSNTIKKMIIPRCGNPDIIHQTSHGHDDDHHQKSGKLLIHTTAHYSFFNGTPKWPSSKYNLKYNFINTGTQSIDVMRSVCARAFRKWANVSKFTFQEASRGEAADLQIGFFRGDHGDGLPFDGPGRTTAHAFAPQDGRFHYDADENWSTNPGRNEMDLESIAVHEIGHLLGLDHSNDSNAVMYSTLNTGVIKRNLAQDDINGIQYLYR